MAQDISNTSSSNHAKRRRTISTGRSASVGLRSSAGDNMPTYNKLVRDNVPDIIRQNGDTPVTHIATPPEYTRALQAELREEVDEFLASGSVEKLADILEVVYALAENNHVTVARLNDIRWQKAEQRGAFSEHIILEEVITPTSEE